MIKIRLLFVRTCTLSTSWLHPLLPSLLLFQFVGVTSAGNCLIRGNEKIVDCANVTVNTAPAEDMKVQRSGYFSGNYGEVEIYSGVNARISGNTDDIRVRKGATLHQDGNSDDIYVDGIANMYGTANYWDGPSSKMVRAFGTITSVIAGKPVALGAHGSLTALSAATQGAASGLQS
jgi:hypothetical protein